MPVIKISFFLTALLPRHHTQAHPSLRVSSFLKRDWHIYLYLITFAQATRVTTTHKLTEYGVACFTSAPIWRPTPWTGVHGSAQEPPCLFRDWKGIPSIPLGWKGPDSSEQHKCVISVLWMGHPSLSTKSPAEFAYINLWWGGGGPNSLLWESRPTCKGFAANPKFSQISLFKGSMSVSWTSLSSFIV